MDGDPEVEARLTEVVKRIAAGAAPLTLTDEVADNMRGRYRNDFVANKDKWPDDEAMVLRLSHIVGELAAVLTRGTAAVDRKPAPTTVDDACANWAGFIVSKFVCPGSRGPRTWGRHCSSYEMP